MTTEERKIWYRLEDAVIASGMTKTEIALEGGFHRQSITFTGKNHLPSCRVLLEFCKVTGASADWILGLEEYRYDEAHHG